MKKPKVDFPGKVFDRYGKVLVYGTAIAMVPRSSDSIHDYLYLGAYHTVASGQQVWLKYLHDHYRPSGYKHNEGLLLGHNPLINLDNDIHCPNIIVIDDYDKINFWKSKLSLYEESLV